jgi:hypothetical protein
VRAINLLHALVAPKFHHSLPNLPRLIVASWHRIFAKIGDDLCHALG